MSIREIQYSFEQSMYKFFSSYYAVKFAGIMATLIALTVSMLLIYSFLSFVLDQILPMIVKRLPKKPKLFIKITLDGNTNFIAQLLAAYTFLGGSNFFIRHGDVYYKGLSLILNKCALLYICLLSIRILVKIMYSINSHYEKHYLNERDNPIDSYINAAVIVIWVSGIIIMLALLLGQPLVTVLTSIGAISAVLILVFKDTLLGVVSSVQANMANIVRVGERIAISRYGIDGVVCKVSVHVVQIKNNDNTLVTIPTYVLTSETVKNWRNIHRHGTRLIQTSLFIDASTIKFVSSSQFDQLQSYDGVSEYLKQQITENKKFTNLELYRAHLNCYVLKYFDVDKHDPILVNVLEPRESSIPLEIMVSSNHDSLNKHEQLKAELIEYAIAILEKFELSYIQIRPKLNQKTVMSSPANKADDD